MEQEELRQELYAIYRKKVKAGKQLHEIPREKAEHVEELRKN